MNTVHRIYSTGGFNLAHVDVTAALCKENDIKPQDVERVEAVVNWLETLYPSPAFPMRAMSEMRVGSTHYFDAYGVVKRGYSALARPGVDKDPPEVLEMMKKVTIIPSKTQTSFGPKITIYTKSGKEYTKESTGREFMWDFKEEVRRIMEIVPGLPISAKQFDDIVTACRDLDKLDKTDKLIQLSIIKKTNSSRSK